MFKISLIIALLHIYQTVSLPQDEFSDSFFPDGDYAQEVPLDLCQLPSNLGFTGKYLCCIQIIKE